MTLSQNKTIKQWILLPLLLLFFFFFNSCQTVSKLSAITGNFNQQLYSELEKTGYIKLSQSNFEIHICRLDLDAPDFQLIVGIDEENLFNLEDFAEKTNAVCAINTTQFSNSNSGKKTAELMGVTKFNNQIITPPLERYSALGFFYNESGNIRASVIQNQTEAALQDFPSAFGGYFTILKDYNLIEYKKTYRSRTACGLDESGRYLYILSVISKIPSDRSGFSYADCSELFLLLGCKDAIEFDGGHSTALVSPQSGAVHTFLGRKIPAALGFYFSNY